mmetsp:Transcript_20541/g.56703  ORF Transcript_20541/g.56703 Transcript_20541/m.56703 type:complete len:175 (+) Transcript_20541:60-584(+)|eukprot:CAMPEP_0168736586 /NCGR_PEP_ID=MMETSP0724-20121128/9937_1 /TAXON_ID=265536 /ORGANISM="Amphiprora sp., Strain CCMP467" /LENGTH=174 /DNA_ID=CAMNT_0008783789 /DNA_START=51 /DNA_END=575 /DNA_ORIENTATION=+
MYISKFVHTLALLFAAASVDSFAPSSFGTKTASTAGKLFLVGTPPGGDDNNSRGGYSPDEEFNLEDKGGSVDWDAEWKKVMEEQGSGKTVERPGEGYYKSDAEIAAIRTANKATKQINKAAESMPSMPSMPSMNSLTSDPKFLIGILVVISVGLALISAPSNAPPASSDGSYYI